MKRLYTTGKRGGEDGRTKLGKRL